MLYPKMPTVRIVGSDIAHAVPLTLIAGAGHWWIGSVDLAAAGVPADRVDSRHRDRQPFRLARARARPASAARRDACPCRRQARLLSARRRSVPGGHDEQTRIGEQHLAVRAAPDRRRAVPRGSGSRKSQRSSSESRSRNGCSARAREPVGDPFRRRRRRGRKSSSTFRSARRPAAAIRNSPRTRRSAAGSWRPAPVATTTAPPPRPSASAHATIRARSTASAPRTRRRAQASRRDAGRASWWSGRKCSAALAKMRSAAPSAPSPRCPASRTARSVRASVRWSSIASDVSRPVIVASGKRARQEFGAVAGSATQIVDDARRGERHARQEIARREHPLVLELHVEAWVPVARGLRWRSAGLVL